MPGSAELGFEVSEGDETRRAGETRPFVYKLAAVGGQRMQMPPDLGRICRVRVGPQEPDPYA